MTLSDLSAPAKATVTKLTAEGTLEKIACERRGEAVVYDIEATVGGKGVEYEVDAAGKVLSSEQSLAYDALPAAVRSAAEKQLDPGKSLTASREQEKGKTYYEVEGTEDGVKTTLKMTAEGKIVETEHD